MTHPGKLDVLQRMLEEMIVRTSDDEKLGLYMLILNNLNEARAREKVPTLQLHGEFNESTLRGMFSELLTLITEDEGSTLFQVMNENIRDLRMRELNMQNPEGEPLGDLVQKAMVH